MRVPLLASCSLLFACGKLAGDVGDAAADATPVRDAGAAPDTGFGAPPDAATSLVDGSCAPFWCGCGDCISSEIVCTSAPPRCPPQGCPSACAALAQTICKNAQGPAAGERCVRVDTDAGQACLSDQDCPPFECCPIRNAMVSHCIRETGGPCGSR